MFEWMAVGEIRACWVICTNPVASVPDRATVIAGLEAAELVIVSDTFADTETVRHAEADGVMINSERTLTLAPRVVDPPDAAWPDWKIIAAVGCELGFAHASTYSSAAEIVEEIRGFANPVTGYDLRGVTYERLRETPAQWPAAPGGPARNPIRYRDGDALSFPNPAAWPCSSRARSCPPRSGPTTTSRTSSTSDAWRTSGTR